MTKSAFLGQNSGGGGRGTWGDQPIFRVGGGPPSPPTRKNPDLLPKIHKRLHDLPGRPVISNIGYYNENISSVLDYNLQPLAQKVKSYIKDTNHFLNRLRSLGKLPQGAIPCTIDVVGLYPNIPHSEGLTSLQRVLELRDNKQL